MQKWTVMDVKLFDNGYVLRRNFFGLSMCVGELVTDEDDNDRQFMIA